MEMLMENHKLITGKKKTNFFNEHTYEYAHLSMLT
jgi:hypothetical protein